MSPDRPDIIPRGFFFDVNSPGPETKSPASSRSPAAISSSTSKTSKTQSSGNTASPTSREWWETDPSHPLLPGKSTKKPLLKRPKEPTETVKAYTGPPPISPFELNLPEHLPSSPLCPKHPKYIGKGNRVCVYHGRKKSVTCKKKKGREGLELC